MKVQYVGMFDAVDLKEVADARGYAVRVARGEVVEVPDELGERLLEQVGTWVAGEAKGESRKAKGAEAPAAADPNTEGITPSEG